MNGKKFLIVMLAGALGAAVGALACVSLARLLRWGKPGGLALGMAGAILGAFSGRAAAKRF